MTGCRGPDEIASFLFGWPGLLTDPSLLLGSVKNCCPLNWKYFQSSCYFFSTDTLPWTASLKSCANVGAHLVIINTLEEQVAWVQARPLAPPPGVRVTPIIAFPLRPRSFGLSVTTGTMAALKGKLSLLFPEAITFTHYFSLPEKLNKNSHEKFLH